MVDIAVEEGDWKERGLLGGKKNRVLLIRNEEEKEGKTQIPRIEEKPLLQLEYKIIVTFLYK